MLVPDYFTKLEDMAFSYYLEINEEGLKSEKIF